MKKENLFIKIKNCFLTAFMFIFITSFSPAFSQADFLKPVVTVKPQLAIEIYSSDGMVKKVKKLIKKGADVNAKGTKGWTPLMFAARGGNMETVKFLISSKADVNAKNELGITALMIASLVGNKEVITYLLNNGADANLRDNDGNTAIFYAIDQGQLESLKNLVAGGADINTKDYKSSTVMDYAPYLKKNSNEIIKYLKSINAKMSKDL